MTILRLILGDQLNPRHTWFASVDAEVVYVMMEVRQETDYVLHHAQKVIAVFAAMRAFAAAVSKAGHRVEYLAISHPENQHTFDGNLDRLIARYGATSLEWQSPDEWRLDRQLRDYAARLDIRTREVDTEHFHTTRCEAAAMFQGKSSWLMESFYRSMRKKHGLLLEPNGEPIGGRWNFDRDNRRRWTGSPPEPPDPRPVHDHRELWAEIEAAGVRTFGEPHAAEFRWPSTRAEALAQLDHFATRSLPHFGPFQDAMSAGAGRLFHSLLSFALNVKMLGPCEVVSAAQAAYFDGRAPLASVEGFIRQVIGWREFVRGVYWARMPQYASLNFFGHVRELPNWFWTGQTKMRCLAQAIGQSLDMAYSHHIQRLMLTGNFALLAGMNPQAVHQWYLGVYIDAFEWVELPNTLGMSQYADGGLLATKPYVSSAAYIDRMSDCCRGCHFDRKARVGVRACPFNALYWDFLCRHEDKLSSNPRLGMAYRNLRRMPAGERKDLQNQAAVWIERMDSL